MWTASSTCARKMRVIRKNQLRKIREHKGWKNMKAHKQNFSQWGEQTKAIHAGEFPDPETGASAPNLVMSTTFVVGADTTFSVEGMEAGDPFVYTRWGNPTIRQLEEKLAVLEGAETAVAFAGGRATKAVRFCRVCR
jgi:methionine-gamma-lyase